MTSTINSARVLKEGLLERIRKLYVQIKELPPVLVISGGIVLFFFFIAAFGHLLAPYDYTEMHIADRFTPPSAKYILGTDEFGRDLLSRILVGSRDIVLLAGIGTLAAVLIGTVLGLLSGFIGGTFDEILMRLLDVFYSIPTLLFAMLLLGMAGPSRVNILFVIAFGYSVMITRVVRSVVLESKTKEYVEAAKMRGESTFYTLFQEILPSVTPALVVETCIRFAYSIFLVATLGFLGLGVQPPSPDWGLMVVQAQPFMKLAPWTMLVPAIAIVILVIAVNLMADGIVNVMRARSVGENR